MADKKKPKDQEHPGEALIEQALANLTENTADPAKMDAIDARKMARDIANAKKAKKSDK